MKTLVCIVLCLLICTSFCWSQPLEATEIFTPYALGALGQDLAQIYLDCTATEAAPSGCKETMLRSLERELAILLPPAQPLPQEERAAGYVDLINFETDDVSTVAIGIYDKYRACKAQGLSNCEDKEFVFESIYWPEQEAEAAEDKIDEAWETFVKAVAADVHKALNKDPACFIGGTPQCVAVVAGDFPVPDPFCVTTRITQALQESIPKRNLEYWQSVVTILARHLPNATMWRDAGVPFDVVTAPIFDVPHPEQYFSQYGEESRAYLYFYQAAQAAGYPDLDVPILPGDRSEEVPGLYPLEDSKQDFETATPYEHQEFGFSSFFELWPQSEWTWFFDDSGFTPKPALEIFCAIGTLRIPLPPFWIAMPALSPALKGFYEHLAVAEGYFIPRTKGEPVFTLNF
jgi:hypothetical protein